MPYIRDNWTPLCYRHNPNRIDPETGLVVKQACSNGMSREQQCRSCQNCPFRTLSSMAESDI